MSKIVKYLKSLVPFRSMLLAVFFGFMSFLVIQGKFSFYLPGTNALSDPREVFNSLGSALTGPAGAVIIAVLSTIVGSTSDLFYYIMAQHLASALWIGIAYKKLVYERTHPSNHLYGWIFLQAVYSFVVYIPSFFVLYQFYHNLFVKFVGSDIPFWNALFKLYGGWLPEIIFTMVMTSLILMAIPEKYKKPKWGNPVKEIDRSSLHPNHMNKLFQKNLTLLGRRIISVKSLVIALLFGLASMFTSIAGVRIYLQGNIATTDPKEIFNILGAAATGPFGAVIVAFISSLFSSHPEYFVNIFFIHLIGALWVSLVYKKLIYEKYDMPVMVFGWIVMVTGYYLITTEFMNIVNYYFFPDIYRNVIGAGVSLLNSFFKLTSGYLPEFLFTAVITSLVLVGLPAKYRKPLWGEIKSADKQSKKSILNGFYDKIFGRNFIAVRLSLWFVILFSIPLIYLSVLVRNYFIDFLLTDEGIQQYETVRSVADVIDKIPPDSIKSVLKEINTHDNRTLIVYDHGFQLVRDLNDLDNKDVVSFELGTSDIKNIKDKNEGFYRSQRHLFSVGYKYIKSRDIYLISISNPENLTAKSSNLVLYLVKNQGLVLLIIALISGMIIWLIVGIPLRKITAATVEIGKHNYSVSLNSSEMSDEVGVLAEQINIMKENVKYAEEQLVENEYKFRVLYETANDAIFLMEDDKVIECNGKTLDLFKCTREQIVGKSVLEYSPEYQEDGQLSSDKAKNLITLALSGKPQFFEWVHFDINGNLFYVDVSLNDIRVKDKIYNQAIIRDISERKRYEKEILKNQAFIERINEQSPDIIYIYDAELDRNIYTNKNIARYLGYKENELSEYEDDFLKKIIHPEDIHQFDEFYNKINSWESEYVFEFEYRVKARNGEWRWFRGKEKEFERNEHGKIISLVGTVRDVTESKLAEDALKASEQRFKMLTESTFEGIAIVSDHKFVDANDQLLELLGGTRENIIGRDPAEFFTEDSRQEFIEKRDYLQTGTASEFILQNLTGKGIPVEIRARYLVVNNKDYRIASVRDISERKRHDAEIKNAMKEIEFLINSLPIAVISVDSDLTVRQYNEKALAYRNKIESNDGNKKLFDLFPYISFIKNTLYNSISDNTYLNEEKTINDDNGEVRSFNITVFPYKNPTGSGSIIIIEDITERRKIESLMIQSEKMLSVAGLAAGMAHEINNPLGTIVQGCQNILRRVSSQLPKNIETAKAIDVDFGKIENYFQQRQIYEIIDSMRTAAARAADIIKNMLTFSRKSESKKIFYNADKLMEETITLAYNDYNLKQKYDFKNIKIVKEYESNLPTVRLTVTEIQQVILNILQNAAQAIKSENSKTKLPTIIIRLKKDEKYVVVEIEDNGPGMDEKIRQRIFEPFFTTKDVGEGTGLGLSVSYMIITTNHQGIISVESVIGEGTKFIIKLPR